MIACDSPTTHSTLAEEFASIRSLSVLAFTVFFSNVPIKRCQKNVTHKITIGKIKIPILCGIISGITCNIILATTTGSTATIHMIFFIPLLLQTG